MDIFSQKIHFIHLQEKNNKIPMFYHIFIKLPSFDAQDQNEIFFANNLNATFISFKLNIVKIHLIFFLIILQVMCQKSLGVVYAFSIFSVVITSVFPQPATTILCERRCESSTPNLGRLKLLWHRMSKRIGKDGM